MRMNAMYMHRPNPARAVCMESAVITIILFVMPYQIKLVMASHATHNVAQQLIKCPSHIRDD